MMLSCGKTETSRNANKRDFSASINYVRSITIRHSTTSINQMTHLPVRCRRMNGPLNTDLEMKSNELK